MKCILLCKNTFCQKVIEILSSIGIGVERVVLRTLVANLTILQLNRSIQKVFACKMLLSGKFSLFLNLPHCSVRMIIWIFFLILVVWCWLVLWLVKFPKNETAMLPKLTSFLGFLCIESSGGLTRECVEKVPLKVFSCVHRLDLTIVYNNLSSSCRWWDQVNAMCVSQNIWRCHDPNNWLKICKFWIIVSNRVRSTLLVEWYLSCVEKYLQLFYSFALRHFGRLETVRD